MGLIYFKSLSHICSFVSRVLTVSFTSCAYNVTNKLQLMFIRHHNTQNSDLPEMPDSLGNFVVVDCEQ